MGAFFDGDLGKLTEILQVFSAEQWENEVQMILENPKIPIRDPQGVATRSRGRMTEEFYEEEDILQIFLEDEDDQDIKGVTFK